MPQCARGLAAQPLDELGRGVRCHRVRHGCPFRREESVGKAVDAAAQDTADPATRVDRAMGAYVEMVLSSPALYSLTFGTDARVAQSPELRDAGLGAYGALHRLVKDASRSHLDPDLVTSMLWATMHGSVMLVLSGHTEPDRHLDDPLTLVRHAAIALLGIDLSGTS